MPAVHLPSAPVFLIGPRASGKTTVARLLAGRLGWDWVDTDDVVEARAGRSVRDIFAAEGEAGFRRREAAALEQVCGRERHFIATGGGVVLAADNRQRLRQSGRVVWLTADAATLSERLGADPASAQRRPALSVGGLAEVEETLRLREPLYHACADCEVATAGRSSAEVAQAVIEWCLRSKVG
jgi:shikimate kinase